MEAPEKGHVLGVLAHARRAPAVNARAATALSPPPPGDGMSLGSLRGSAVQLGLVGATFLGLGWYLDRSGLFDMAGGSEVVLGAAASLMSDLSRMFRGLGALLVLMGAGLWLLADHLDRRAKRGQTKAHESG